jgi:glycerol uptake facilitator-like aquaporin
VQDRGLAAYIAELIGTLLLVFFITSVVALYVATGQSSQFGSDYAVVGLVHFLVLFALIISIGVASGGHFNPAVTAAFIALRRIDLIDGPV